MEGHVSGPMAPRVTPDSEPETRDSAPRLKRPGRRRSPVNYLGGHVPGEGAVPSSIDDKAASSSTSFSRLSNMVFSLLPRLISSAVALPSVRSDGNEVDT